MAKHIVRVMRGKAKPGHSANFRRYLTKILIPRCLADPGLISIAIGARRRDKPDEFTVVTIWKNLAALKKFVGADWRRVYHLPGQPVHLEKETVAHYYARE